MYLFYRTQQVVINNSCSNGGNVLCGVFQASILGPLLVTPFINDLPLSLKIVPVSVDLCMQMTLLLCKV